MTWQTIESAPKTGEPILLYADGKIEIGAWHADKGGPGVSSNVPQQPNWCVYALGYLLPDEGWDTGAGWFMEIKEATHWMPLPTCPSSGGDEEVAK